MTQPQYKSILILEQEYQFLLELVRANGRVIEQWPLADVWKGRYLAKKGLAEWDGQWLNPTALGVQASRAKARRTICGTAVLLELDAVPDEPVQA